MMQFEPENVIKELNRFAREFAEKHQFKPIWHKKIRRTDIWKTAKGFLIAYRMFGGKQLRCDRCGKPIWGKKDAESITDRYKCALHHIKYDDNEYFAFKNVQIIHMRCHKEAHGI
jgi:hypothetical protein